MKRPTPFQEATLVGFVLPFAIVGAPLAGGALERLMQQGWIYFLLPVFAAAGVVAFLYTNLRFAPSTVRPGILPLGLLLGGSVAGALLLWLAAPDRPPANRVLLAASGGPLLIGFWLWIGSLLAVAAAQGRIQEKTA